MEKNKYAPFKACLILESIIKLKKGLKENNFVRKSDRTRNLTILNKNLKELADLKQSALKYRGKKFNIKNYINL